MLLCGLLALWRVFIDDYYDTLNILSVAILMPSVIVLLSRLINYLLLFSKNKTALQITGSFIIDYTENRIIHFDDIEEIYLYDSGILSIMLKNSRLPESKSFFARMMQAPTRLFYKGTFLLNLSFVKGRNTDIYNSIITHYDAALTGQNVVYNN